MNRIAYVLCGLVAGIPYYGNFSGIVTGTFCLTLVWYRRQLPMTDLGTEFCRQLTWCSVCCLIGTAIGTVIMFLERSE